MGHLSYLLDTCTFIWLSAEPSRLSSGAVKALDDRGASLTLSDVSVWEIGLKWRRGKVHLPCPPRRWIAEQTRIWRLSGLTIQRAHLQRETELPEHHQDPFDRLLVAQALEEDLIIVTPDEAVARYPVPVLW